VQDPPRVYYTSQADLFSVGVILFILLVGYPPFPLGLPSQDEALEKMLLEDFSELELGYWKEISADAKDLVRRLLRADPGSRLTASAVLEHPWIVNPPEKSLQNTLPELKKFNAKRKWKVAISAVTAATKIAAMKNLAAKLKLAPACPSCKKALRGPTAKFCHLCGAKI